MKFYPEIPYLWKGKIRVRDGSLMDIALKLCFHNDGEKKFYALYQDVPMGGNFQIKEFPQVYNKALILDYMEIKGYSPKMED